MELFPKSPQYKTGETMISAESLNRIRDAIPRTINGDNILVKRYGDRYVIEGEENFIRPEDELKTFIIYNELEDLLQCISFDFFNTIQEFDPDLPQQMLDAGFDGPIIYVAKAEGLQKTPYDGKTFDVIDNTTTPYKVAYTYDAIGSSRLGEQLETLSPPYTIGTIIVARQMQTGYTITDPDTGIESSVIWEDINVAGRHWEVTDAILSVNDVITSDFVYPCKVYDNVDCWGININTEDLTAPGINTRTYLAHYIDHEMHGDYYTSLVADNTNPLTDTGSWLKTSDNPNSAPPYVLDIVSSIAIANGDQTLNANSEPHDFASSVTILITDSDNSITAGTITVLGKNSIGSTVSESISIADGTWITSTAFKTIVFVNISGLVGAGGGDTVQVWITQYPLNTVRSYGGDNYIVTTADSTHAVPAGNANWTLHNDGNPVNEYDGGTTYQVGDIVRIGLRTFAFETDAPASGIEVGVNGITYPSVGEIDFFVGSSGTDFAVVGGGSGIASITYNLPSASLTNRGVVTTGAQTFLGDKTVQGTIVSKGSSANPKSTITPTDFLSDDGAGNTIDLTTAGGSFPLGGTSTGPSMTFMTASNNYGLIIERLTKNPGSPTTEQSGWYIFAEDQPTYALSAFMIGFSNTNPNLDSVFMVASENFTPGAYGIDGNKGDSGTDPVGNGFYGGILISLSTSGITSLGTVTTGTWNAIPIDPTVGGTGGDSSSSTGIAHVSAGAWSYSAIDLTSADVTNELTLDKGGTAADLSSGGPGVVIQTSVGAALTVQNTVDPGAITDSSGGSIGTAVNSTGTSTIDDNFATVVSWINDMRSKLLALKIFQ